MRSPLVALHNALYTALNDNVASASTYAFVPMSPSYPYIFIDEKQVRKDGGNKGRNRYLIRAKLVVLTNSDSINDVQVIVNEIAEDALSATLTLTDDWAVFKQSEISEFRVFPANHLDGSQGHAAEIFNDFIIIDTL